MKNFIVSIVLIVIWTSTCSCKTTVYEEGVSEGPLLSTGNARSNSPWHTEWQSRKVRYPIGGEYLQPIGYLKVVNNLDSSYSTATIKDGGVGSKSVVIEYYAPAFRAYDYSVEIRGAPLLGLLKLKLLLDPSENKSLKVSKTDYETVSGLTTGAEKCQVKCSALWSSRTKNWFFAFVICFLLNYTHEYLLNMKLCVFI